MSDVSVVIPCFNSSATLQRAVSSVAAQTNLPREVIVVDDASTDDTVAVARALAVTHPLLNVSVVSLGENVGPGAARNAGWNRASHTYVAFLDADDAWHPRKLEIQGAVMARTPRCVLSGHRYRVDESGSLGDIQIDSDLRSLPESSVTLRDFLLRNRFSTPSAMVRRDIPERFHPDPSTSDDYLLWMTIVSVHGPAVLIDLPLTTLFKDAYGHSGLSGSTHEMQRRELTAFAELQREGHISGATRTIASAWSILKYLRRVVLLALRIK